MSTELLMKLARKVLKDNKENDETFQQTTDRLGVQKVMELIRREQFQLKHEDFKKKFGGVPSMNNELKKAIDELDLLSPKIDKIISKNKNMEDTRIQIKINNIPHDIDFVGEKYNERTFITEQQIFYAIVKTLMVILPDWESLSINKKVDKIIISAQSVGLDIRIGESHEPFMSI